jgi:hypothetical protein
LLVVGDPSDSAASLRRGGLRLDPVRLPFIGTAEIGGVALEHDVGLVVAGEYLAGDGIAEAVITQCGEPDRVVMRTVSRVEAPPGSGAWRDAGCAGWLVTGMARP